MRSGKKDVYLGYDAQEVPSGSLIGRSLDHAVKLAKQKNANLYIKSIEHIASLGSVSSSSIQKISKLNGVNFVVCVDPIPGKAPVSQISNVSNLLQYQTFFKGVKISKALQEKKRRGEQLGNPDIKNYGSRLTKAALKKDNNQTSFERLKTVHLPKVFGRAVDPHALDQPAWWTMAEKEWGFWSRLADAMSEDTECLTSRGNKKFTVRQVKQLVELMVFKKKMQEKRDNSLG